MKKTLILIVGFVMSVIPRSSADPVKMEAPPKVEESAPGADRAAVHAASSEADRWAATAKPEPKSLKMEETATEKQDPAPKPPPSVPTPPPSATPPPRSAAPAPAKRSDLNEMKGKLQSKSSDPKTLRVLVDGGFNVEFTYDNKTTIMNGGSSIPLDDLEYGDELIIHYAGKEMCAIDIDRVGKVPRPQ